MMAYYRSAAEVDDTMKHRLCVFRYIIYTFVYNIFNIIFLCRNKLTQMVNVTNTLQIHASSKQLINTLMTIYHILFVFVIFYHNLCSNVKNFVSFHVSASKIIVVCWEIDLQNVYTTTTNTKTQRWAHVVRNIHTFTFFFK